MAASSRRRRRKRLPRPVRLTELVSSHARKWRFVHLHRMEVIRQKWAEAAGPFVARHAAPVRLVRKVLRVAVEDATWASELAYLTGPILERLQQLLPGRWVESIKVVQGEPLPPAEPPAPPVELAATTPRMERRVERATAAIEDPELQESVRKAMLTGIRRLDAEMRRGVETERNRHDDGDES